VADTEPLVDEPLDGIGDLELATRRRLDGPDRVVDLGVEEVDADQREVPGIHELGRAAHRTGWAVEGGQEAIAARLDLVAPPARQAGADDRGVLLDAPAYRGVKRLPIPKDGKSPGIVTAADVRAMVQRQGLAEIGEGDCVFLYTGHGDLWLNAEWKGLSPEEKAKRRDEFAVALAVAGALDV